MVTAEVDIGDKPTWPETLSIEDEKKKNGKGVGPLSPREHDFAHSLVKVRTGGEGGDQETQEKGTWLPEARKKTTILSVLL